MSPSPLKFAGHSHCWSEPTKFAWAALAPLVVLAALSGCAAYRTVSQRLGFGSTVDQPAAKQPSIKLACQDELSCRVANATSVIAYRVQDSSTLNLAQLTKASDSIASKDRAELSSSAAQGLMAFVLSDQTYENPKFVSSCPFSPDYAYEFKSSEHGSAWWLLSTCSRQAALVDTDTVFANWIKSSRYLTKAAMTSLEKCNGDARPAVGQGTGWRWADSGDCLMEVGGGG